MRSLTAKLALALILTSLAGVVLVAVIARWTTVRAFEHMSMNAARDQFVSAAGEHFSQQGGWQGMQGIGPRMGGPNNSSPFALVAVDGRVIVGRGPLHPGQIAPAELLAEGEAVVVDGQQVATVITVDARPLRSAGEAQFIAQVDRLTLIAAGGAALLALAVSTILARALTRPLGELTSASRRIAAGDFGEQVAVRSRDEIGELAQAFNQMSRDLAAALEARRQMTADIAHELRTPLTVIAGHLEGMHEGVLEWNASRIETLYGETQGLMRLVEDLRILSLADAGTLRLQREALRPVDLLARTREAFAHAAQQAGVEIIVAADPDLPQLLVDPGRIAQVLNNLVANALRHSPSDSQITLTAGEVDGGVRLAVTDQGEGIPTDVLPRIFDRFYRADPARGDQEGASGLGLSIARSLIEAHGGAIGAESAPGQGATIWMHLPLHHPTSKPD